MNDGIDILYEDSWIMILNKPSGLLTVPGIGEDKQDCLASRAQADDPNATIVHRLDRDTSGVIILALDRMATRELARQFRCREVGKTYEALVYGHPIDDSGTIHLPMRKDSVRAPRHRIDMHQGKPSITHWRVIRRFDRYTHLILTPETGRSHQLRLHLQAIGHPIIGDPLYAFPTALRAGERLMLHATSITISHPVTGESVTVSSPPPFGNQRNL